MGERLKGKVAIVTGAARGLGRAHALALAAEGAKVVVNDLGGAPDGTGADKAPADEVVAEIKKMGGEAVANYENVADYEGAERIIKSAIDNFGRLDILVNNAGILRDRMVFNMTEEEWDIIMSVHLRGHFNCTKHACVVFRQQRSGRIINTASESGLGNMGQANYSAAKEGVIGFTRTVALDIGKYGVTCNAIRPRARTRMTDTPELRAAMEKARAMGASLDMLDDVTKMEPEDVSPLVVWLCTDEAADINGCDFIVGTGQISLLQKPEPWRSIYTDKPWSLDQLAEILPRSLCRGLENPAPPAPPKG